MGRGQKMGRSSGRVQPREQIADIRHLPAPAAARVLELTKKPGQRRPKNAIGLPGPCCHQQNRAINYSPGETAEDEPDPDPCSEFLD